MIGRLVNYLAFQLGWFSCVEGAARGHGLAGLCVALLVIAAHLARTPGRAREAALLVLATAVGAVIDSLFVSGERLRFAASPQGSHLPPAWDLVLWPLFATTLNSSLGWLRGRPVLAALCGAIGGPLAYSAAERLGAVRIVAPQVTLPWLALSWGALTPFLLDMARRLSGTARTPEVAARGA
ncbi:MAG TPA: DUF2878 domain-containing protein [Steroidobacteraceae bacterium]|nr:DUF2878 domain-containing protein [Steroidobacteraceae bacterium]